MPAKRKHQAKTSRAKKPKPRPLHTEKDSADSKFWRTILEIEAMTKDQVPKAVMKRERDFRKLQRLLKDDKHLIIRYETAVAGAPNETQSYWLSPRTNKDGRYRFSAARVSSASGSKDVESESSTTTKDPFNAIKFALKQYASELNEGRRIRVKVMSPLCSWILKKAMV